MSTRKKSNPKKPAEPVTPRSTAVEQFAAQGLDEKSGAAALTRLGPLLAKLPVEPPSAPRLNVQQAASATLAVVQAVDELELRPRYKHQAELGEFELDYLERLPDLARACLSLRHELDRTTAQTSEAQLPESLVTQALAVRTRMLRVLDFHFDSDPQVAPGLAAIRSGSGYQDLASDLMALGGLYGEHKKTLAAGTPLHYRAGDSTEAAQLASRIVAELGKSLGQAARSAQAQQLAQVTTLLVTAYDEVTAVGRHLCRHNPAQVARFPSLFTVTRSRRRPSAGDSPSASEPAPASS